MRSMVFRQIQKLFIFQNDNHVKFPCRKSSLYTIKEDIYPLVYPLVYPATTQENFCTD